MEATLSEHENKRQTTTSVTTTTQTEVERAHRDLDVLTVQEERVIRMLHGLSEDGPHPLKFALGANQDVKLQLARLEYYLVKLLNSKTGDPLEEDELTGVFED